jgi:type IV pilus assembly protein PilO
LIVATRFSELSIRAQILVYGVVCLALVAVVWRMVLGPADVQLAAKTARLRKLEADVGRARTTTASLPAVLKQVRTLEAALRETTAILPDEKDPQDVLRSLHAIATESMLEISSFTAKAIVARPEYSEWPIELGLTGGYHDVGRFLDRVATMSRLMSVTDLNIQANAAPGSNSTISVSCAATAFVFHKDAALPLTAANLSAHAPASGRLK